MFNISKPKRIVCRLKPSNYNLGEFPTLILISQLSQSSQPLTSSGYSRGGNNARVETPTVTWWNKSF